MQGIHPRIEELIVMDPKTGEMVEEARVALLASVAAAFAVAPLVVELRALPAYWS